VAPELGALTRHADARVRADACHLLSLTHAAEARPWLQACLQDADAEVREIAAESLQTLGEPT
jgi:HEAT repeat protein